MTDINPYESPKADSAAEDQSNRLYQVACEASKGTPYPPEAFVFLVHGFDFADRHVQHQRNSPDHLDAVDLCWCLHDLAVHRFRANARNQLADWNIHTTRDFGELMYRLIALGHSRDDEGDSIEDFDGVFEFGDEFKVEEFKSTLIIDEED